MKATVVPAQVTTVEDRIMGRLGFSQLMLLFIPVFFGGMLYMIAPPLFGSDLYKYIIIGFLTVICMTLAIRVRGKIVAQWLSIILRYNVRPTYYLFDKNTSAYRRDYDVPTKEAETVTETAAPKKRAPSPLAIHEVSSLMHRLERPQSQLSFETTKKGGLYVRLTEVEE